MRNIAIIPARSGSKGLPNKNIKLLNGKPLLAYTIEAAFASGCFDEVMVSTDSEQYAEIAKEYGAKVPFLRSDATATDTASSWDMVREVLGGYQKVGMEFDTFSLLQPTSPLRNAEDIKCAYQLLDEKNGWAVVSVCEMEHSPMWCNVLNENLELDGFIQKERAQQRQKMQTYYRLNGAIYIAQIGEFYKNEFLYREGSYAYVMSAENSIDIDTEDDFRMAEWRMRL